MLRSGKEFRKQLFAATTSLSPGDIFSTPVASLERHRNHQENEAERVSTEMADEIAAFGTCCESAQGKVRRIRCAIETAALDHKKFSVHALKLYLKTVDSAYDEYNSYQNKIYLADPTKKAEYEPKFVLFEEEYEFARIAICQMMEEHDDDKKALDVVAAAAKAPPQTSSGGGTETMMRLPPTIILQQNALPTFDGRYENWFRFKQLFNDIADKCVNDSAATKLHYLDKALVGKAQGAIDQQFIRNNDYAGAWNSLKQQFENLPALINDTITKLLSLKAMTTESSQQLKTLVDDVDKCVNSLAYHDLTMNKLSSAIITTLLSSKLDSETRKIWESNVKRGELPVYKDMIAVLRKQQHVLERCESAKSIQKARSVPAARSAGSTTATKAHAATIPKENDPCPVCKEQHLVEKCDAFKRCEVKVRYDKAKQIGLCFVCLKKGHRTSSCNAKVQCSKCSKMHHILLHYEVKSDTDKPKQQEKPEVKSTEEKQDAGTSTKPQTAANCVIPNKTNDSPTQVLLATAIVNVFDDRGDQHKCRVLLDSGAMANFVSQRMADLLQLKRSFVNIPIIGVNEMRTLVKYQVNVKVKSRISDDEFRLNYLVVPRVTGSLPASKVETDGWPMPIGLNLADPTFFEPSRIDMLIGAEAFFNLLLSGKVHMCTDLPTLQESVLGWLVSGRVGGTAEVATVRTCQAMTAREADSELNSLLKQFWLIDDQTAEPKRDDDDCERHFVDTVRRNPDGRYVVRLPFRNELGKLGDSRHLAEKRFYQLERRLEKNPDQKEAYGAFIKEYIDLDHCRVLKTEEAENTSEGSYYLPHHCVLRPDSSSTKLRVVFDGSADTTSGLSLNDLLMIGPPVQDTLFEILMRFRLHKYAFTADVPKMYRQVRVHDDDTKLQRILWRDKKTEPLREIELTTVTYGTAAAPFLATRVLNQLAKDEQETYPKASQVVTSSFYVDDVLSGAPTIAEAKQLQQDLIALLSKGGFDLHKWCANDGALLESVPTEKQEKELDFQNRSNGETVKTLGLRWNPVVDEFLFSVKMPEKDHDKWTKRQVLSETARIFDPLGLLSPVIVLAKMIIQELWKNNLGWDDVLPPNIMTSWKKLRAELAEVSCIQIPRRVTTDDVTRFELHGFADASIKAYGCCIYLRSIRADGSSQMFLLSGKSRVTPPKEAERKPKDESNIAELTMPRLELCAARLLAGEIPKVMKALNLEVNRVVLWSDSQIVLAWLENLKPDSPVFLVNRVKQIRELTGQYEWKYINTKCNPADLISRGVYPKQLATKNLWWKGPPSLQGAEIEPVVLLCELVAAHTTPEDRAEEMNPAPRNTVMQTILECSNFRKLERIFGYVTRFLGNCKANADQRRTGRLTPKDYNAGVLAMVSAVQLEVFNEELKCLAAGKPVKGKINNLDPFLNQGKLPLRVGGRLRHSDLPFSQRHPMILPAKHHLTNILIEAYHREFLHVGSNGLLAALRRKFWPTQAKQTIRKAVQQCVKCFRAKPKDTTQFMGDYPKCRVTIADPFSKTGVDYAGPILLKQGRGKAPIKGYIAIFVCMCTKAIHLELVTSMSTQTFLAALHRFTGRRGNVSEIWSDNGTNFIGADRLMKELRQLLHSQILEKKVSDFCQPRGIAWKFNPPKAPHQGGLWEAGVKSAKYHLHRVLNESHLTYEEMNTLLIQIEAVLNSRPLCQQSDDPLDYRALSPGHFLVGRELTAIAEPLYDGLKENTLSRYQLIQKRKQDFFRRWSSEYLTELQQRGKWNKRPSDIRVGMLVVLKADNTPPQQWKLGRIIETHPGKDNIVRVVTVRTAAGDYRRPTTQIAILPIPDNMEQ